MTIFNTAVNTVRGFLLDGDYNNTFFGNIAVNNSREGFSLGGTSNTLAGNIGDAKPILLLDNPNLKSDKSIS